MKKIAYVAVAALAIVACNKEGGVEKGLTITPETKTVYTDEELPVLELKATPADLIAGLTIEWTSDAADIVTVSDKGELAFAVEDIEDAEKTVTITAAAGDYSAKCTLTVKGQIARYEVVDLTADFGFKMLDRNVGAKTTEEIGNFYQWGKNTPVASNDDTKVNESYDADWSPESKGFVDWTVAENTPCPKGWRLPTEDETKAFAKKLQDMWFYEEYGEGDEEEYEKIHTVYKSLNFKLSGKFTAPDKDATYVCEDFWTAKQIDETTLGLYEYANMPLYTKATYNVAVPVRCVKSAVLK